MHIKKGIKFLLHKRAAGQTTNPAIRMRVTLHGERPLDFPLRHNIDAADWNTDTMRALPSCAMTSTEPLTNGHPFATKSLRVTNSLKSACQHQAKSKTCSMIWSDAKRN